MKKTKSEKLFKLIFFFSAFLFVLSIGLKLYLCGSLAVKNDEFEKSFYTQKEIEKEIEKLSFENSSLSCISYLEQKAKEMGFVEMTQRLISIDLNSPSQVAVLTTQK